MERKITNLKVNTAAKPSKASFSQIRGSNIRLNISPKRRKINQINQQNIETANVLLRI